MNWEDIGKQLLGKGLPLLGGALGGPAGVAVGGLVASVLGVAPTPEEVAAKLADPDAANRLRELQERNKAKLEEMTLAAEMTSIQQTNATYRAELHSNDKYTQRMRPTCGYLIIVILLQISLLGGYVVLFDPKTLPSFTGFVQVMQIPLSVALGVLGVYVKKRSDEKINLPKQPGGGLLGALFAGRK